MKERLQYICETCGYTSWDKEAIEKCELSHQKPVGVTVPEQAYKSTRGSNNYPYDIAVQFEDGATVKYHMEYNEEKRYKEN